jgi:hypothetical protein
MLVGVSAYVRGNGPLVAAAVEAAQAEVPGHRMAELLGSAMQHGVRPDEVREMVTAAATPAACGIT